MLHWREHTSVKFIVFTPQDQYNLRVRLFHLSTPRENWSWDKWQRFIENENEPSFCRLPWRRLCVNYTRDFAANNEQCTVVWCLSAGPRSTPRASEGSFCSTRDYTSVNDCEPVATIRARRVCSPCFLRLLDAFVPASLRTVPDRRWQIAFALAWNCTIISIVRSRTRRSRGDRELSFALSLLLLELTNPSGQVSATIPG